MKTSRFITAGINLTDALSMQSIDYIFSLAEVSHKLQLLGFFFSKTQKNKIDLLTMINFGFKMCNILNLRLLTFRLPFHKKT